MEEVMAKIIISDDFKTKIKSIQQKYMEIIGKLGDIELQKYNLDTLKVQILQEQDSLKQDEKKLMEEIGKTYGFGRLNITSGELDIETENI